MACQPALPASEKPRRFSGIWFAPAFRQGAHPWYFCHSASCPFNSVALQLYLSVKRRSAELRHNPQNAAMLLWLLRSLALFPLWLLQAVGAFGGLIAFALSAGFRRKTADNLRTAGLYSPQLARASAAAAGRAALETCYIWFRPTQDLVRKSAFRRLRSSRPYNRAAQGEGRPARRDRPDAAYRQLRDGGPCLRLGGADHRALQSAPPGATCTRC